MTSFRANDDKIWAFSVTGERKCERMVRVWKQPEEFQKQNKNGYETA